MNRREILKFLALAPLAAALPLVADDEHWVETFGPVVKQQPFPFTRMSYFSAHGNELEAKPVLISIGRDLGPGKREFYHFSLLEFGLNLNGGVVIWRAPIGQEIIFLDDDSDYGRLPLVTCSDPRVKWYLPLDTPRGGAALSSDWPGLMMLT